VMALIVREAPSDESARLTRPASFP
jgi:hypothetical protein